VTELHITMFRDGIPSPRRTSLPYPFPAHDAPLRVLFETDRIVVTDLAGGSEITYPGALYALD
jgi:hypothetical protein